MGGKLNITGRKSTKQSKEFVRYMKGGYKEKMVYGVPRTML